MEQLDQHLIERYLAGELTPQEKSELELRAERDSHFRKHLAEYRLSIEALKLAQRDELKDRFKQRDKILDKKQNVEKAGKKISFWWLAAAAIICALIGWFLVKIPDRPAEEAHQNGTDTIQIVETPVLNVDSPQIKTIETPVQKEALQNKNRPKQGEQIFAENFEAYKDESLDPTSRSGEENPDAAEQFMLQYWEGKNKEARISFNNMSPEEKQNDNYRFMYALVLMSLHETGEASQYLMNIIENHKSPYTSEANLYYALCEIKSGNFEKGRARLKIYLDNKDSTQKEKAKKILEDLQ